jgi:HEAT repeat protein
MSAAGLEQAPRILASLPARPWPDALAAVQQILAQLDCCGDPQRLEAIAGALPRHVAPLAPELCLALRQLALALARAGANPRLPEDLDRLEPRLQIAWLQVRLTTLEDPTQLDAIDDLELLRALTSGSSPSRAHVEWLAAWARPGGDSRADWGPLDAAAPLPLLLRMTRAADVRLRAWVLPLLGPAINRLALTGTEAFECLSALADDPERSIRLDVFRTLREPWLCTLSPAAQTRRNELVQVGLGDHDARIVHECIDLAVLLERRTSLLALALDVERQDDVPASVLAKLGAIATEEDLELGLLLAGQDPLRFGPAVRQLLLAAHRHGAFVREPMIPALLEAFDHHLEWTGEELVRVTHITRVNLIEVLGRLDAGDRRWIRRARILGACGGLGASLGAAPLLGELLARTDDLAIAGALIDAAGRMPEYTDEAALLAWLPRIPEHVIAVLRVKGSAASARRLQALVEDPHCPEYLRPLALDGVWALADERRVLQRELSAKLGPRASGLLTKTHLATRDDLAAGILCDPPWSPSPDHDLEPLLVLASLCASGERRFLPEVTRRFRAIVHGYVRDALAGDFTIKRLRLPELEHHIYLYGCHLIAHGRSVRRFIENGPETGRDLVLTLTIDWLHEHPAPSICVALLETIARHEPVGANLRAIENFSRHRDVEVRRAAIEALLAAGESARGLELSLCRLSTADDPRIIRQALAGVARFSAGWAEPMVVAALRNPSMGVKKAAAEALGAIATPRSIPALIEWLGHHDNVAFRVALLKALKTAAGPSAAAAILVEALVDAGEQRRRNLLHEALTGLLPMPAVLRLARSSHPSMQALVEAVLAGEVKLAAGYGTLERLTAALHRTKLRPLPAIDDPTRRLRIEGFSAAAALALVDALEPQHITSDVLAVVRAELAEWTTWLGEQPIPHAGTLELLLRAATSENVEQLDRLLDLVGRVGAREVSTHALARFVRVCLIGSSTNAHRNARALTLVRACTASPDVSGIEWYAMLRQLGAVRTRADLDACLSACRIGPNLASDSEKLLSEALAIPPTRTDEARELGPERMRALVQLREGARDWHRLDPTKASAWLSEVLAARPLDLPALPEPPPPELEPAFIPRSRADLDRLHDALADADPQVRQRAAALILAWPDARTIGDGWRPVLDAYLAGDIDLDAHRSQLASLLDAWPDTRDRQARALELVPSLDHQQRLRMLSIWIRAWDRGELHVELDELLRPLGQELLIPIARTHAEIGDFRLLRFLRHSDSLALRALVEQVRERSLEAVAHLLEDEPKVEAPAADETLLADPIAGLSLDALVTMIRERDVNIGLAVRAIHALAKFDERGADALEPFVRDRRSRVRSAALRALRTVAPRERSLKAAADMLTIELRSDVILQLMASIAHGRYAPGLASVVEYLGHRDNKLRNGARDAVLAWGTDVLPALR